MIITRAAVRWRVCAALLTISLALGLIHTAHAAHDARQFIDSENAQAHVDGQLLLFRDPEKNRFIQYVKRIVPEHDQVRIVVPVIHGPGGAPRPEYCTSLTSGPAYWWFVYSIAPRASVCDPTAKWTVYFGIAPPPGATVHQMSPKYAVVHRSGAAS